MSDIQLSQAGNVAYMPAVGATVFMKGLPAFAAGGGVISPVVGPQPGTSPTEPTVRREWLAGDDDIVYWGLGNDYPQTVRDRFSKNTLIPETLSKKAAFWLGGGVFAAENELSEEMVKDPEIRVFMKSISTNRYLEEGLLDLAWYVNGFPEFILSKDRSKIVQIHANETAYCRWGRNLDKVYINANWPNARATDPETIVLPVINPYRWDRIEAVRQGKAYKYVYPISFPSVGRSYYQLANTDSIISSGWLDVLEAIPQFKKYGLANQMSLLYHIEVSADYWEKVYGDRWAEADFDGKMAIRDEFLADLMKKLTNVQNAHSSVLTDKWVDDFGKENGVTIHVLNDVKTDGKYNEDNSEGNASVLYAAGMHGTLVGYSPANAAQRSGGSDMRQAFWIFLTLSNLVRRRILELFYFVAEYNGWLERWPDLTFKFRDTLLTTLDTGDSTAPSTSNPA